MTEGTKPTLSSKDAAVTSKRLRQTDDPPFALTERETARMKTFPEALDALADWYDYDSTCAEAVGEIECSEFDDKRAAELRAQAARLREGYGS